MNLTFSRADAEGLWSNLIERLRRPIEQALRDSRIPLEQIEGVLLVGGSSRIPAVRALATGLRQKPPLEGIPPDESVALGAAVQAALKIGDSSVDDLVSTDIAPFSLGVATVSLVRGAPVEGVFVPVLERGTVLPTSRAKVFSTVHPDQSAIRIRVFQGEHSLVSKNTALGQLLLEGLTPGQLNDVIVRFTYDLNGMLEVEATDAQTKKQASAVLSQSGGRMTPEEVAAAKARLSRLKVHPSELLPNRTALELAETLFVTLLGAPRELLGAELAMFRGALEGVDASAITSGRCR
jgi:molecular chaperone HscC